MRVNESMWTSRASAAEKEHERQVDPQIPQIHTDFKTKTVQSFELGCLALFSNLRSSVESADHTLSDLGCRDAPSPAQLALLIALSRPESGTHADRVPQRHHP